jgi:hypothetical protein
MILWGMNFISYFLMGTMFGIFTIIFVSDHRVAETLKRHTKELEDTKKSYELKLEYTKLQCRILVEECNK